MSITMITWIAVGSVALISLIALLKIVLLNRRMQADLKQRDEQVEKLDSELNAILDGNYGMGNQLKELRQDLKDTKEKQHQLEQRDLGALPYNQAVRMVAGGATADQLVEQCGLSRAEADLVTLLHQKSPPVVAPIQEEQEQQELQPPEMTPQMESETSEGAAIQEDSEIFPADISEEEEILPDDDYDGRDFDELARELEEEFSGELQISDPEENFDSLEEGQSEVLDTTPDDVNAPFDTGEALSGEGLDSGMDAMGELGEEAASTEDQSNTQEPTADIHSNEGEEGESTPDFSTTIERVQDSKNS